MLLATLGLVFGLGAVFAQDYGDDPVLEYHCRRAGEALAEGYAFQPGHALSFTATAYLADLSSTGDVERLDTAVSVFFYTDGQLDSSRTIVKGSGRLENWEFNFPNVFEYPYVFNFYPNDTGGADLAIGFDTDTSRSELPTGMVEIDRPTGRPTLMYLHYPHRPDYRNFSLSLRLAAVDNLIVADSIVELGAKMGILMPEYYRKTTILSDIRALP